jgi:hypothetical protein
MDSKPWQMEKEIMLKLPLEERRLLYKSYVPLRDVECWRDYALKNKELTLLKYTPLRTDLEMFNTVLDCSKDDILTEKISLFEGDITQLEVSLVTQFNVYSFS